MDRLSLTAPLGAIPEVPLAGNLRLCDRSIPECYREGCGSRHRVCEEVGFNHRGGRLGLVFKECDLHQVISPDPVQVQGIPKTRRGSVEIDAPDRVAGIGYEGEFNALPFPDERLSGRQYNATRACSHRDCVDRDRLKSDRVRDKCLSRNKHTFASPWIVTGKIQGDLIRTRHECER